MKLDQVRAIAKSHGISPGKLPKASLIKSIQLNEGNLDCFASAASSECNQKDCLWKDDCLDATQKAK